MGKPVASVVIPAHNEAQSIGRLLDRLVDSTRPNDLEVVVVCNGCTDETASVAGSYGSTVQVVELERPSKHWALVEGDRIAKVFPRLYVDADVEIDRDAVHQLVGALGDTGTLAVAPERVLMTDRSSRLVRSYYRVWTQLPVVRASLVGRGVVGLSAEGHRRIADRPEVLGDDLYIDSRFAGSERRVVVGARSRISAPRTVADLIRRRTRAVQGNIQLAVVDGGATSTATSVRSLLRFARAEPRLWPHLPTFVGLSILGRLNHRRRRAFGRDSWLRDESSRS